MSSTKCLTMTLCFHIFFYLNLLSLHQSATAAAMPQAMQKLKKYKLHWIWVFLDSQIVFFLHLSRRSFFYHHIFRICCFICHAVSINSSLCSFPFLFFLLLLCTKKLMEINMHVLVQEKYTTEIRMYHIGNFVEKPLTRRAIFFLLSFFARALRILFFCY